MSKIKRAYKYYRNYLHSYQKIRTIDVAFIFSAQNGLYLYKNKRIHKLMKGFFYGITYDDSYFYIVKQLSFENNQEYCSILKLTKDFEYHSELEIRTGNRKVFPIKSHQILLLGNTLWITNTRRNLIWLVDKNNGKLLHSLNLHGETDSTQNDNYKHYNSLYFDGKFMFVLAHGYRNPSFFMKIDPNTMQMVSTVENIGRSAHNIVAFKEEIAYLNSGHGTFIVNGSPQFRTNKFLRGLALSKNFIIIGGSEFSPLRFFRNRYSASLFVLNRDFSFVEKEEVIGSGDICDHCCPVNFCL